MKRLGTIAVVAAVMIAASACGTLRVKVDVLQPAVVEAEVDRLLLRDALPRVLAQSDTVLVKRFDDVLSAHTKVLMLIADQYEQRAAKEPKFSALLRAAATSLRTHASTALPRFYTDPKREAVALNAQIRYLAAQRLAAPPADRPVIEAALVSTLRQLRLALDSFDKLVDQNIGDEARKAGENLPVLADVAAAPLTGIPQAMAEVTQARKSLILNQGIVESPYAYVVAAASDDKWSTRFNEAYGAGQLGNLNVAIKMVSLGDFTLKGLTFDPSDVVRATSRVTTQALVLAAQAYGVPIKPPAAPASGQPAPAGTALATSSERLGTLQQTAAAREAKLQDYRGALITIALAITREQAKLAGADAERKAAIDAIKASFDAHKSRLNLTSLQGAAP